MMDYNTGYEIRDFKIIYGKYEIAVTVWLASDGVGLVINKIRYDEICDTSTDCLVLMSEEDRHNEFDELIKQHVLNWAKDHNINDILPIIYSEVF